ncbi:MAG: hypothetical protein PSU94_10520 [Lacunisphaera sp.]|nr:hypothetical protein [Lacunisphaera sp.]
MRLLVLVSIILSLARPLEAAEQLVTVTPQTLGGWQIVGTDRDQMAKVQQLILPDNAQLSRLFSDQAVILHLVSRPVFSQESARWPLIGVGPLALALVKQDGLGRLVLVTDETTAHDLPWSVSLEQLEVAVDLIVAYDPLAGAGLIGFQDQLQEFAMPASAKPVEVWLGAGAGSSWPLDHMEVLLLSEGTQENGQSISDAESRQRALKGRLKSALGELLADGGSGGGSGYGSGSSADPDGVAAGKPGSGPALEIFTPPSVRRATVIELVRATVVRNTGK